MSAGEEKAFSEDFKETALLNCIRKLGRGFQCNPGNGGGGGNKQGNSLATLILYESIDNVYSNSYILVCY